jgi:hypothetical protein
MQHIKKYFFLQTILEQTPTLEELWKSSQLELFFHEQTKLPIFNLVYLYVEFDLRVLMWLDHLQQITYLDTPRVHNCHPPLLLMCLYNIRQF